MSPVLALLVSVAKGARTIRRKLHDPHIGNGTGAINAIPQTAASAGCGRLAARNACHSQTTRQAIPRSPTFGHRFQSVALSTRSTTLRHGHRFVPNGCAQERITADG